MKAFKVIAIIFVVTLLFIGCTRTQPTPPVATNTATTEPTDTSMVTGGEDKAAAESYVKEWVVIQGDYDTLKKEWDDLVAGADKITKAELKTKLEEHIKKHEALRDKVKAMKAESEDTKAHQTLVIEVVEVGLEGHNAFKDMKTKEGITADEQKTLQEKLTKSDDTVKSKTEEAQKKFNEIKAKNNIKEEGSSATPTGEPTGAAPSESPSGTP